MDIRERLGFLFPHRNGLFPHEVQPVASGFFLYSDDQEERAIVVGETIRFYEDETRTLDFTTKGVGGGEVIERGKENSSYALHRWDGGREEETVTKGQPLHTAPVSLSRYVVGFTVTFDSKVKTLRAPGVSIVYRGTVG